VKGIQVRLRRLTFAELRENMAISGTPEHYTECMRWLQHEFHLGELIG
jgi:hypothetical protein